MSINIRQQSGQACLPRLSSQGGQAHLRKRFGGQGMMEAVVAIGILITAVIIIISLSIATTDFGRRAEARNVATNLAREGLEIVRQKRDSNWLSDISFVSSIFPPSAAAQAATGGAIFAAPLTNFVYVSFDSAYGASGCYTTKTCTCYTAGTSCALYRDANTVFSNIPSATETPYRRLIFVQPKLASGADVTDYTKPELTASLHVVSQVYWKEKNSTQTVTLETDLYDWQTNN